MRVTPSVRPGRGGWGRDESGAMALLVILLLPILLAVLGLTASFGSLWAERRELLTATDAGALAGASAYVETQDLVAAKQVCETTAATNRSTTTSITCLVAEVPSEAAVEVRAVASAPAPTFMLSLASVYAGGSGSGPSGSDVSAVSVARAGLPWAISGARPVAVCLHSAQFAEWAADPEEPYTFTVGLNDRCVTDAAELAALPSRVRRVRVFQRAGSIADISFNTNRFNTDFGQGLNALAHLCDNIDTGQTWTENAEDVFFANRDRPFAALVYAIRPAPFNAGSGSGEDEMSCTGVGPQVDTIIVGFVGLTVKDVAIGSQDRLVTLEMRQLNSSGVFPPPGSTPINPGVSIVKLCHPTLGCAGSAG